MWFDNLNSDYTNVGNLLTTTKVLEAFTEIEPQSKCIERLRQWLLIQRQGEDWGNNANTTEVIYALLTSGDSWTEQHNPTTILLNDTILPITETDLLTGDISIPIKCSGDDKQTIKIFKQGNHPAWGATFASWIAPINEVKAASVPALSVSKSIYTINESENGSTLSSSNPKVGDKVRIAITITTDRDLDYIVVKDELAASMIQTEQLSNYKSRERLWYYYEPSATCTNMFISYLPKGTHILTYDCYCQEAGTFATGITDTQSEYAPLIVAHSAGNIITVTSKR
jgi:hypothetical protein